MCSIKDTVYKIKRKKNDNGMYDTFLKNDMKWNHWLLCVLPFLCLNCWVAQVKVLSFTYVITMLFTYLN